MEASERTVMELARAMEPLGHLSDDAASHDRLPLANISDGLVNIIRLQSNIAERCMQGRSLDTFDLAAHHLRNLSYVGGHLVVNGADIIPELKDAVAAFRAGRLHAFGEDLGRAWRKVLLSKIGRLTKHRDQEAVRKTSLGLVTGFFSNNIRLEWISNKGSPHEFEIDLDRCTNGQNERFFQEVWDATWLFFEKVAASKGIASHHEWQPLLMVVLADLPTAMRYCGITKEQEAFLIKSLKALEKLQFNVDLAHRKVHTNEISVDLAQAVEHWTAQRWPEFGNDLGKMLQELVLLEMPRAYEAIDDIAETGKSQILLPWMLLAGVLVAVIVARGARRTSGLVYVDESEDRQLHLEEQVLE